ncbi:MAG: arsenate reductase (azurin) small subunit [Geminicoccaceae bacterium]
MSTCRNVIELGRRQFLKRGSVGVAGAAAAAVTAGPTKRAQGAALVDYPANRLANVADLAVNEPLDVAYPDDDAPGVLLKLGQTVEGGVGPDGDIVGFSTICPHKGFPLHYDAERRTLNCSGHYSVFDCEAGGQQTWGHATQNLPQYVLRVDEEGEIYAEGLDELLYGRLSNVL